MMTTKLARPDPVSTCEKISYFGAAQFSLVTLPPSIPWFRSDWETALLLQPARQLQFMAAPIDLRVPALPCQCQNEKRAVSR
ncbi:hypothetical protein NQZ79_g1585 [Umbelopsis isabellina]|nr:hypothetical protein NQZ79_g1585 [Umbelopsis isabellina]